MDDLDLRGWQEVLDPNAGFELPHGNKVLRRSVAFMGLTTPLPTAGSELPHGNT